MKISCNHTIDTKIKEAVAKEAKKIRRSASWVINEVLRKHYNFESETTEKVSKEEEEEEEEEEEKKPHTAKKLLRRYKKVLTFKKTMIQ
jgi:hypothetical protein